MKSGKKKLKLIRKKLDSVCVDISGDEGPKE